MPEGDTVHRTAAALATALEGAVLLSTDFRVPAFATVDLSGEAVVASLARGKHLLLRIGADHTLHTHLKMEGAWHLYRPGSAWQRPAHQARVVLTTKDWAAVGFALGIVELLPRDHEAEALAHLGPDLLGPDWSAEEAVRRLTIHPDSTIGAALLDQRNLAGIGNMYAAEVLFLCGVDPRTPIARVPSLSRVVARSKAVLGANVQRSVQSTTGQLHRGERHWVYQRTDQPCLRCGSPIRTGMLPRQNPLVDERREPLEEERGTTASKLTPSARATYWCPTCQPFR